MAPIVASNTVQVSITGTVAGRPFANVMAGIYSVDGDAAELASDIVNSYIENLLPSLSDVVTVSGATYVDLDTLAGETGAVPDVTLPAEGESGDGSSPPNVALLIRWNSGGNRSQRNGRSYLPGIVENVTNPDGSLTGGFVTAMQANVDAFISDIEAGAHGSFAVVSKSGPTTYIGRTVATGTVQPLVATQRRRLRG